jgi:hypothetical protein
MSILYSSVSLLRVIASKGQTDWQMAHLLQYDWSISTATEQDLLIQHSPVYFDHSYMPEAEKGQRGMRRYISFGFEDASFDEKS